MIKKFDLDVPVYWLTVASERARHTNMIEQFFRHGIDCHTLVTSYPTTSIWELSPTTAYPNVVDNRSYTIALNHLRIIKRFYYESTCDMALIFEDDIDLDISKYWTFSLSDVVARLPDNWSIVQLCLVRDEALTDVRFRPMRDSDWSVAAYLISRKHAQRVVEQYVVGNGYNVDSVIRDYRLSPSIEAILFCLDFKNMYTFPILTENLVFPSTFYNDVVSEHLHNNINYTSGQAISSWWHTHGSTTPIEYFFEHLAS